MGILEIWRLIDILDGGIKRNGAGILTRWKVSRVCDFKT